MNSTDQTIDDKQSQNLSVNSLMCQTEKFNGVNKLEINLGGNSTSHSQHSSAQNEPSARLPSSSPSSTESAGKIKPKKPVSSGSVPYSQSIRFRREHQSRQKPQSLSGKKPERTLSVDGDYKENLDAEAIFEEKLRVAIIELFGILTPAQRAQLPPDAFSCAESIIKNSQPISKN